MDLLQTCLTRNSEQANDIRQLELILKDWKSVTDDNYRDRAIFCNDFWIPSATNNWGGALKGTICPFIFRPIKTTGCRHTWFYWKQSAIVLSGPQKGKVILKEEADKGFALLNALSAEELKKAIIDKQHLLKLYRGQQAGCYRTSIRDSLQ
jgi:hypothetical protein